MAFEGLASLFGGMSPQKIREEQMRQGMYQEGDFDPTYPAQLKQTPDMMQRTGSPTPNAVLSPSTHTTPDYEPVQKDMQDLEDIVRARNEAKMPTTPRKLQTVFAGVHG